MPGQPATSAFDTKKTGMAAFMVRMSSQLEWFATTAPGPRMGVPCRRQPSPMQNRTARQTPWTKGPVMGRRRPVKGRSIRRSAISRGTPMASTSSAGTPRRITRSQPIAPRRAIGGGVPPCQLWLVSRWSAIGRYRSRDAWRT